MKRPTLKVKWRTNNERADAQSIAIVADVLRASTTIVTAFSIGAKEIFITKEVEDARRVAKNTRGLLIGERGNKRPEGFDYGNSPIELQTAHLKDATVVFTSTNFPHAIEAAHRASRILIGALVNLSAVCALAARLAEDQNTGVCIVLAGGLAHRHSVEDEFFAASAIRKLAPMCICDCSVRNVAEGTCGVSVQGALAGSAHAKDLISSGYQEDVQFAFTLDTFDIVPEMVAGRIVCPRKWK